MVNSMVINVLKYNNMRKWTLLLAILCGMQVMATDLVLVPRTGQERTRDISLIGKWVFQGEKLVLLDKSGNVLAAEETSAIRKIVFSDVASPVGNVADDALVVYPNPTQDILCISGADAHTSLRVFDLSGHVLTTAHGAQINVSALPAGTYLLQIGTQVVRFIKQ